MGSRVDEAGPYLPARSLYIAGLLACSDYVPLLPSMLGQCAVLLPLSGHGAVLL